MVDVGKYTSPMDPMGMALQPISQQPGIKFHPL